MSVRCHGAPEGVDRTSAFGRRCHPYGSIRLRHLSNRCRTWTLCRGALVLRMSSDRAGRTERHASWAHIARSGRCPKLYVDCRATRSEWRLAPTFHDRAPFANADVPSRHTGARGRDCLHSISQKTVIIHSGFGVRFPARIPNLNQEIAAMEPRVRQKAT